MSLHNWVYVVCINNARLLKQRGLENVNDLIQVLNAFLFGSCNNISMIVFLYHCFNFKNGLSLHYYNHDLHLVVE